MVVVKKKLKPEATRSLPGSTFNTAQTSMTELSLSGNELGESAFWFQNLKNGYLY